jgi:hypothetical protein
MNCLFTIIHTNHMPCVIAPSFFLWLCSSLSDARVYDDAAFTNIVARRKMAPLQAHLRKSEF